MLGGQWGVPILTVLGCFGVPVLREGLCWGEQGVLGGRCGGIWQQGVIVGWGAQGDVPKPLQGGYLGGRGLTLGRHGERRVDPGHTGGLRGPPGGQRWVGLGGGLGPRVPTGGQLHLHTVMDKLLLHRARGGHWGGRGTHTGDHGGHGEPLRGAGLALGGLPAGPGPGSHLCSGCSDLWERRGEGV